MLLDSFNPTVKGHSHTHTSTHSPPDALPSRLPHSPEGRALCAIGMQSFYKHLEHLSVEVGDSSKPFAPFRASVSFFLRGKQSYIISYTSSLVFLFTSVTMKYTLSISIRFLLILRLLCAWGCSGRGGLHSPGVCVCVHIGSVHIQHTLIQRNTWVYTNEKLRGDYCLLKDSY